MRKTNLIIVLIILLSIKISAQDENQKVEFKPSGSPIVIVFSNYHSTFTNGKHSNLFEITRGYLGYEYKFSKNFSGKIVLDVGNPKSGEFQMDAYLKNALIKYTWENLTVNFGLTSSTQFAVQEKIWGNRYVAKSFQDEYKMGPSADLGLTIDYKFNDFISADFALFNGEGYKTSDLDTILKGGLGITIKPVKVLTLRTYYDYMRSDTAQQTLAFFAGYSGKKLSIGWEYNNQFNNSYVDGKDYSGYSFYSSYSLNEKLKVFGRFDELISAKVGNTENAWNYEKDGQLYIFGIEFSPVTGIKFSPNFQGWNPRNGDAPFISSVFFNCEFKL